MWKFLGKGWKTVTGAALWAVGNTGIVTLITGAVGISGSLVSEILTKVGAALVVLGIAHKIERADPSTPPQVK